MNERSKDLIAYLLSKFEKEIDPIVFIKLVYLCEIEAIEKYGKRFSDLKFIHYKYGPYAAELHNSFVNEEFAALSTNDRDPDLLAVVEAVLEKWKPIVIGGGKKGLINKTYHTLPFQETSYGKEIKFEKYIGNQYISEIVVDKKQYKKLSDPNLKLYSSKNKELQRSLDEVLTAFV